MGLARGIPMGFFWFFSGDALFGECFTTSSCERFRRFGRVFLHLSPNLVNSLVSDFVMVDYIFNNSFLVYLGHKFIIMWEDNVLLSLNTVCRTCIGMKACCQKLVHQIVLPMPTFQTPPLGTMQHNGSSCAIMGNTFCNKCLCSPSFFAFISTLVCIVGPFDFIVSKWKRFMTKMSLGYVFAKFE